MNIALLTTTAHKIWQSVLGRNVGFPLKAFLSGDKKAGRNFATFHSQTVSGYCRNGSG